MNYSSASLVHATCIKYCRQQCEDRHDFKAIEKALNSASDSERPVCIIANTTKGKGISFMEDSVLWHYRTPKDDEFDDAINELNMDDQ